jgi:tetratricopeptide (TPR) repeat protein
MTHTFEKHPGVSTRKTVGALTAFLFACGVLAGAAGWYFAWYRSGPAPPAVALDGVEAPVLAAIEKERAAVQKNPHSAEAWGRLGVVFLAHRFKSEARICFVRAEERNSNEPRWPYFQGIILTNADTDSAIAKLRRAVELCGDQPDAPRLRLADLLATDGRSAEAQAEYRHLVQLNPSHPPANLGLARLAYEQGEMQASLAYLKESSSSSFTRKVSHTLLAMIHQRSGDHRAAERELHAVDSLPEDAAWPDPFEEETAPVRADKRNRLAQATQFLDQNRVNEGMTALEQLTRDYPDWEMPWRVLGILLLQQRKHPSAEQALRRATQLAPDSVQAHYYLGCVASLERKSDLALASFRRATELKPDYAIAQFNLGQCLKQRKDLAGAIEAFRSAAQSRPYMADAHVNLGELLAQAGQTTEAITHLKQAVDLNPGDEKVRKLLEQVQTGNAAVKPK